MLTMEKLHWIEVQNFSGIKHAKFENFTDINVFIGKNNTSRSTILESIYLNLTNGCQDKLKKIVCYMF